MFTGTFLNQYTERRDPQPQYFVSYFTFVFVCVCLRLVLGGPVGRVPGEI